MFKNAKEIKAQELGTFSIKDIEAITGIKSHTLRIWEQRYELIKPKRSDTNIRYYDDGDLKLLLNVSVLNQNGVKISEIAKKTHEELNEEVRRLRSHTSEENCQIKALISAMIAFDEPEFNRLLTASIVQLGMEHTISKIIFPFLNEVGILWQVGSIQPSHEHFVTNIIKQKLYVAIDGQLGRTKDDCKKFLLFLPEHEKHSLGLLFANYLLRSKQQKVLYLGQEVPLRDLKNAFINERPDYIITLLNSAQPDLDKQAFVDFLSANWPYSNILISGSQFLLSNLNLPVNVKVISSIEEFIQFTHQI